RMRWFPVVCTTHSAIPIRMYCDVCVRPVWHSTTPPSKAPSEFALVASSRRWACVASDASGGKNENRRRRRVAAPMLELRHFFEGDASRVGACQSGWLDHAAHHFVFHRSGRHRRRAVVDPAAESRDTSTSAWAGMEVDQGQEAEQPEAQGAACRLA